LAGAVPKHATFTHVPEFDNGHLVIDDAKLSSVLSGSVTGVNLSDVRRLFALTGTSANPGIEFVTGSAKTRAGTTPYSVQITQAADKATLTSTNALAAISAASRLAASTSPRYSLRFRIRTTRQLRS
jgi:hypothetical protein